MPRILTLIFWLTIPALIVSCSQSSHTPTSSLLNESVIYPTDEPPSIQIRMGKETKMISSVNDYPSPPKISLDKTKLSYIAPYDFETVGEVWLYQVGYEEPEKIFGQTEFGEDQSVKQILWLDNDHLLIVTGNRLGTVSSNRFLYLLNISTKKAKSILQVGEYQDIRDIVINDSEIEINIANYNDDFTEEALETKRLKVSELI